MDMVMCTQNINSLFASLGCPVGEDYIISDDCQATLQEILSRLYKEDKYVRGFRRLIANSQVLKKDLLPLFYNVKNDHKILDVIIEILENLMIPVECLFPIDIMIKEDAGRSTIFHLNWLLTACKEAFLNPCATKSVIDYIKLNIKKEQQQLTSEGCRSIDMSLRLLRNLLHIPEVRGGAPGGGASHQNQIIWNLFTQQFDKVLIQLMTCKMRSLWSSTVVQIISLLYKDQQSNTIYKLLNTWCDQAVSESSEDDESNTSPRDQGSNDSSSSLVTSDPTSDSSDCDQIGHKSKTEPDVRHQLLNNQNQAQNRMTEIIPNGVGRKAQVAMRNKHGNSSKNIHPVKHRQLDHTIHGQDQHLHPNNKAMRVSYTSESGLGSSVNSCPSINGSMRMDCASSSPEPVEYNPNDENQETISTSSNEDKEQSRFTKKKPVHQKPLHMLQKSRYNHSKPPVSSQAKKDLLREKLKKRSTTTTLNIKAFLNHIPSEEDISQLMKEFTVDFLLKGYGQLVSELKRTVLTNKDINMDTSHFSWLIMYFLRFGAQLELDKELISPVLSYDIISYLTYEGVNLCEELEVAKLEVGEGRTRILGKLYLIVASLKEIIFTILSHKKINHFSQADHQYFKGLQEKIASTCDLKHLFVLLLRHFDPQVQSLQYLQDIVVANHHLLVLIEECPQTTKEDLVEHIRQFATPEVMKQYGALLACYEDNGEIVNNCVFTMMHHVAGDLDKVSLLFQPSILQAFTKILESDFQICDAWSDLVEFVIQKCLKTRQIKVGSTGHKKSSDEFFLTSVPELTQREKTPTPEEPPLDWSKEDIESLCWFFSQSLEARDPVGHINQLFLENTGQRKDRVEIIENLLLQGLIQGEEYRHLLDKEPASKKPEAILNNKTSEMDILEGIQVILEYLENENCKFFVKWLQNCLLEACYAKVLVEEQKEPQYHVVEPVAYFYTMLGQPVPLVTWTQELWKVMQMEPSIWLLSALNFHLPSRAGQAKIFARIPSEWSADHLYVAALILGPLDSNRVKFDPSTLPVMKQPGTSPTPMDQSTDSKTCIKNHSSLFGFFVGSSTTAEWLQKVKQLKISHKHLPLEDKHERMSVISGDERDWDLTSMCVSEEYRQDDTLSNHSYS